VSETAASLPGVPTHLHGIIPPIVTLMQANEDLDLPRLRQLIDRRLAAGLHGILLP
jgi:dihydrodipicolinate synthase/N-acetylneuraminate lyase